MAWRHGLQINNFRIQAPDESLLVTIPSIRLSWSLGVSQNPSVKVDLFELTDIDVYYRA